MKFILGKKELSIPITHLPRTKAQRLVLNKMLEANDVQSTLKYLRSFSGIRYRNATIDRVKTLSGFKDKLAIKSNNSIIALFNKRLNTNVNHVPLSNNKYLGIEIECFIPIKSLNANIKPSDCKYCDGRGTITSQHDDDSEYDSDCNECNGSGTSNDNESSYHETLREIFRDSSITNSTIKSDGSIRPDDGYFAVEITVLTRIDSSENLKKVCDLLKKLETKVNKSCGMHIHLDMRHKTETEVMTIGKNFGQVLPVLGSMVPKTRRNNDFCQLRVSKTQRYSAVNLTSYKKFKTIEVRLHSSTTDFNKIINWATLLNSIANTEIKKKCADLNSLTEYIYLSENLLEYFSQRIALFSDVPETITVSARDDDSTEIESPVLLNEVA